MDTKLPVTLLHRFRVPVLLIAVLLFAGVGGVMYTRWQADRLWGHLPLVLFLTAWIILVLANWKRYGRQERGYRWLGWSTLGGVLLAAGFPPSPLTPLLFVAWLPFLQLFREMRAAGVRGWAVPLRYLYPGLVLWNLLVTWWVGNTALVAGMVAIWLNALFMSVPLLLHGQTGRILPRVGALSFAAYWMSFEWLHLNWEISWAWLNLGNAFARHPSWIQWYEYTGTFGGTAWILIVNLLFFSAIQASSHYRKLWREQGRTIVAGLVAIGLPIGLSEYRYHTYEEAGRPVKVAVIQPNYEPHYQKFKIAEEAQVGTLLQLSAGVTDGETDYLLWPETSFSAGNLPQLDRHPLIRQLRSFLAGHPGLTLVTGISAYRIFEGAEAAGATALRTTVQGRDTLRWEAYNAAIALQDGADSIPVYIKSKLVPGPEILPYRRFLFFLQPLVDYLDGTIEGLGTQTDRAVFSGRDGKVAPVICYESIFGGFHTGYIRRGGEATFIMTNDGWWDQTAGHRQHLLYARLRAIETRRDIARSANTGVSCFINQRGDIRQATAYGEAAAIRDTVLLNDQLTFYVKWGDLPARIALFTALLLLVNTFVRHRQGAAGQDRSTS